MNIKLSDEAAKYLYLLLKDRTRNNDDMLNVISCMSKERRDNYPGRIGFEKENEIFKPILRQLGKFVPISALEEDDE